MGSTLFALNTKNSINDINNKEKLVDIPSIRNRPVGSDRRCQTYETD